MNNLEFFKISADYILSKIDFTPEIGIILGTGLGGLADEIENPIVIPYGEIPNFLVSTAPSHAGKFILGTLAGKKVACMAGRFHSYEGYSFEQLVSPVRVFKLMGIDKLIVTNAAGAVNKNYRPGDVMIISDHINLCGVAPTRGNNLEEFGPRFFDMSNAYHKDLRAIARECGNDTTLNIHEGVYQFFAGPQFETPAEIRAARLLGADAVGMSTVPEVLTAAHCSLPTLGITLITNMAAGVLDQPITGEEVDETAMMVATPFRKYVCDILRKF